MNNKNSRLCRGTLADYKSPSAALDRRKVDRRIAPRFKMTLALFPQGTRRD